MKRIVIGAIVVGICLLGVLLYVVTRPKTGDVISTPPTLEARISDEAKRRYRRYVEEIRTYKCDEMVSFVVKLKPIGANFDGNVQQLFNEYSGFGFQKKNGEWAVLVRSWKLDNDVCKDAASFMESVREVD